MTNTNSSAEKVNAGADAGVTATDPATGNVGGATKATLLERSITIGRPAEALYTLWRDPHTLPQLMKGFADVTADSPDRAHWKIALPLNQSLEWDTLAGDSRPNEFLSWTSADGASMTNEGAVYFTPAPLDWGTEVRVRFHFNPPGGVLGDALLKLLGPTPSLIAMKALYRFRALAETGEIPTTDNQPAARNDGHGQ